MRAQKITVRRGIQSVYAQADTDNVNSLVIQLNSAFETFKAKHSSELDDIRKGMDSLALASAFDQMNGTGRRTTSSLGAKATKGIEDNASYQSMREWNSGTCRLNVVAPVNAALTNEKGAPGDGGTIPSNPDDHGFVSPVQRPLRLLDVLPSRPTTRDSVKFVQMGTTSDAAEQIHEGDEKAEVDFEGTPRTADIATIAGHTTASRQVLDDAPQLGALIDRVLRGKVRSRLENQLVNGPGGQGKILGLMSQSTALVPTIGVTRADVIGEGLVRMADDGYAPNLVLLNPLDWFRIQITRKNADDDEYVFGSPTMPVPAALWNTSIVTTPSVAEGTSLVLDTSYTSVLDRQAVSVLISNSHKDYFTRNLILILAEMRAGLEVLDTLAVRKITLPAPAAP